MTATVEQSYYLPRAGLQGLLDLLRADGRRLIGPTINDGAIVLSELSSTGELPAGWGATSEPGRMQLFRRPDERLFEYPPGPVGWKRWTFPPRVAQSAWGKPTDGVTPVPVAPDPPAYAFLGVRACDIAALRIHDRVLLGGAVADPDYAARRADTLIVAVECAVAGSTCFCTSLGTGPAVTDGYDLALSELDEGFVVRAGSPAGEGLLAELELAPASSEQQQRAAATVAAVGQSMGEPLPMAGLPERLLAAADSPHWAEVAERCLACANCTLVCPTCFCTSVGQRSELDGQQAFTERSWDSCFTLDFARVAGGNFRSRVQDRYRQWLTHKFGSWWSQFGSAGCVGCGRCVSWCPVGIDVRQELLAVAPPPVASAVTSAGGSAAPPVRQPRKPAKEGRRDGELPWLEARVVETRRETRDVMSLRLDTDDAALLAGKPGQFVMVGLPALGVPPISVSRFHADGLELTIRAAGPATAALCSLERGASLALRGPLGKGWPVELAYGRDVLIVSGGIGLAPLRPLLDALLARRQSIAAMQLAYGARTPADRLYVDELDRLAAEGVVEIAQTVDRAGPEWLGRVGVVTQVIDRSLCSCDRTVAFICGPERMMEATAEVLRQRGVPDERIFVSLERQMQCGVGLCGHCQLGRFFVCRDGPVFSLSELGAALWQEGL